MRSLILLGLGILIGAAALGAVLAAHHGDVTVRATLVRHDDGRVEVGLQQQGADGAWHESGGSRGAFPLARRGGRHDVPQFRGRDSG